MFKSKTLTHKNSFLNRLKIHNTEIGFEATIFPNLGASLQKLKIKGTEMIDGIAADEEGLQTYRTKFNSSILFPFPSRIDKGTYSFKGKHYSLDCNEKALNNALHGHVHDKRFELVDQNLTADSAELIFFI